jgi:uncharacterized protein (DUF362 family)
MNTEFRIVTPAAGQDLLTHLVLADGFDLLQGGGHVALKPNLTWIDPRPGVTTTRDAIESMVAALIRCGNTVSIIESDGGYGTFSADAAFDTHGLRDIASSLGAECVNLSTSPTVRARVGGVAIELPRMLMESVDCIVSMPVPKVHALTRYSGAVKNQWGLIPTDMRLQLHYRLPEILTDLLLRLPPQLVAMDGTYFLDGSGPLEGTPIHKDLLILASHPLVADAVALRLMGWNFANITHLRKAARQFRFDPTKVSGLPPMPEHPFTLRRTPWNWVALAGFKSRTLTYIGYESPLAGPLHEIKSQAERMMGRSTASHRVADRTRGRDQGTH